MSATSVGQIGLDLVVNQKQFHKQMAGVTGLAKKAGFALAAAFSVKKLIDFGKESIKLGSDLQEVQNVVDVTFPTMTKQVDDFAKSAASSFGLSETMAKRFAGTFGAMSKAFGFTEKQAYDMSTALTGLAGDVASFYNLDQEEAYTKLKSVFTGETETLKDLGVVMTQNALDAYAMAKGYGKVTASMSEAEKVALRFAFVQDKLSAATGDFIRTSDSWANQTRVLKLQFDSLKATIGQGLINLFTPIVKVINTLLGKLMTLANAFKAFTELITGNKSSGGSGIGSGITSATEATDGLVSSTEGVGAAAKKAAKEMKALMGFDNLNVINTSSDTGAGGAAAGESVDFGSLAEGDAAIDQTEKKLNPLIERMKELANLFKDGFKAGLGDDFEASLQRMKEHLAGIKASMIDIATDPKVVESFNSMCDKIAYAAGQIAGATVSVGMTVAENLLGGIDKYLDQNKQFIKDRLVGIFDATGEIAELAGNFAETFAKIFEVFRSDTAKQCTADLIGIFANSFLGILELGLNLGRDLLNCIVQPIIDNQDKIKDAITNTLKPLSTVLSTLNNSVKETFEKIFEVYDAKIRPAFEGIADGLSSLLGTILDLYNEYIAPVLDTLATKFSEVWESSIQPVIGKAIEVIGKLGECISVIWQEIFVPFISWLLETIVPVVAPVFESIGKTILDVFGSIGDVIGGVIDILGGLLDFITGIFAGDWNKCWEGVVSVVTGVRDIFVGVFDQLAILVSGAVEAILLALSGAISFMIEHLEATWEGMKTGFSSAFEFIKGILTNVKNSVTSIFSSMWNSVKHVINSILGGIQKMVNGIVNGINGVIRTLNGLSFDIPDWIPELGGKSFGFNIGYLNTVSIPQLAKGGIISTPTLAMMGENNKKEAVVPLDRNLEWRDAIAERIMQKIPGSDQASGSGLTAAEVRSIIFEAVRMFAELIGQMNIQATIDRKEILKAVKQENDIAAKRGI